MRGRKKMLLIECFPDVRFSAKALFFYFTHTSKFLLNDTVVTNCRSQNWRALGEWLFDLDATKLVFLIPGFGIFHSQLKRQEFLLLFCSFEVICARSTQELETEGIEPRSVWLKRTHFFSNSFNKYLLSTHYMPGMTLGTRDRAMNKTKSLLSLLKSKVVIQTWLRALTGTSWFHPKLPPQCHI